MRTQTDSMCGSPGLDTKSGRAPDLSALQFYVELDSPVHSLHTMHICHLKQHSLPKQVTLASQSSSCLHGNGWLDRSCNAEGLLWRQPDIGLEVHLWPGWPDELLVHWAVGELPVDP